jgi:hypothetical protein
MSQHQLTLTVAAILAVAHVEADAAELREFIAEHWSEDEDRDPVTVAERYLDEHPEAVNWPP